MNESDNQIMQGVIKGQFDEFMQDLRPRVSEDRINLENAEKLMTDLIKAISYILDVGTTEQKKQIMGLFNELENIFFTLGRSGNANKIFYWSLFEKITIYIKFRTYGEENEK